MFGKSNSSNLVNGSVTKGLSLTHENLSSSNPIINNNISISQNSEGSDLRSSQASLSKIENEISIERNHKSEAATECNEGADINSEFGLIQCENNFLKAILRIYIGQKIYFNGKYIVCTLSDLIELISLLTNSEVEIDIEPFEVSCCGTNSNPYSKVTNIWVNKDEQRSIFKYSYSQFLSLFDEYKISLKVVRV